MKKRNDYKEMINKDGSKKRIKLKKEDYSDEALDGRESSGT
jgi:hypothetical protein